MKDLLDCPVCGEPCKEIPPYEPTEGYPFPWWQDGDRCTCACGAELMVDADERQAYLKEVDWE